MVHHARDLEIQSATTPWAGWWPKGNAAFAVAAEGNVIVAYAHDYLGALYLNGRRRSFPYHRECFSANLCVRREGGWFKIEFKGFTFRGYNTYNNHFDLYADCPGKWSSGRSLSGLWGNFDLNGPNDWSLIHEMNNRGRLSVLGTSRSYFSDKTPRTDSNGQFQLAFDMEVKNTADLHVAPGGPVKISDETPEIPLKYQDAVKEQCSLLRGLPGKGCIQDIILGADPKDTGKRFHMDAVQNDAKELTGKSCLKLIDGLSVSEADLTFGEGASVGTSFSVMMWYKFRDPSTSERSGHVVYRGKQWSIDFVDGKATFSVGSVSCSAQDAFMSTEWHHIGAVADTTKSAINLYVDGKLSCSSPYKFDPASESKSAIVFPTKEAANGVVGKVYFVPLHVTAEEVASRFALAKPSASLPNCS